MKMRSYESKVVSLARLVSERKQLRRARKKLVFTNGCFDLLHVGHAEYLAFARNQGDALVVAVNSDASVRKNKGRSRPIVPQDERARMLAALEAVDYVILFDDDEPQRLLWALLPDVLVKGADWAHYVAGRDIVEGNGGKVVLAPISEGKSTTNIIEKILGKKPAAIGRRSKTDRRRHTAKWR
jgi:D-beta-D-heptose 7-phosphate kinase/D-beta-D-heptose 1-phosphate adenosyltransferase